jgi:Zinc carboxypeptidase
VDVGCWGASMMDREPRLRRMKRIAVCGAVFVGLQVLLIAGWILAVRSSDQPNAQVTSEIDLGHPSHSETIEATPPSSPLPMDDASLQARASLLALIPPRPESSVAVTAQKDVHPTDYVPPSVSLPFLQGASANARAYTAPPLELERQKWETNRVVATTEAVQIITGFECSTPVEVTPLSPTHLLLKLTGDGLHDWFMFRIDGARGKIVRVDITGMPYLANWISLNPVSGDVPDLDDPSAYTPEPVDPTAKPLTAWNGSSLPSSAAAAHWHFVQNAWCADRQTFSFVQKVDSNAVYIAMRVPHPTQYNERYLVGLSLNPLVHVIEIGRSLRNRRLLLVKIGTGDDATLRQHPCVLVYAGEHADEHDAMWVAQGAIEYLVSDNAEAQQLRDHFTFLIIPLLDPDSTFVSRHHGIITSFLMGRTTAESVAYANWFEGWIREGNRLDIIFDLHNVQSHESPDVACPLLEGLGTRGVASMLLHKDIIESLKEAGFTVNPQPWMRGWSPDRLGGWLSRYFGSLTIAYELNSQGADHHLSIRRLKEIGHNLVSTASEFLGARDAVDLLADIDSRRQKRLDRWTAYGMPPAANEDAIKIESERAQIQTNNTLSGERILR